MQRTTPSAGRVLVVEDNDDVRESLCLLLSLSGYDVRKAGDGAEGVRQALGWRPDAVVSDIGLPGLDGWEVARQVRRALGSGVLLIAVTGYVNEEDRQRSQSAGFDHHLGKPADPGKLLGLLRWARSFLGLDKRSPRGYGFSPSANELRRAQSRFP
jgi:CheY-like chemotaxis protein